MRTFCGAVTETNDQGAVAEHCPHCDRPTCCLLRTVSQGNYIFFIRVAHELRESSCLCTECLEPFAGKPHWSYAEVVPIREARGLELNDLLARTNPILADRIRFKDQIGALGGDEQFAVAYEHVEGMLPGKLRSALSKDLLDWPRLGETQRGELGQHIGALSRAWQFARQIAVKFPTSSGSLAFFLSAPLFGAIVIYMFVTRNWIGGLLAFALSASAATLLETFLFKRVVNRWTREVLAPEAQQVNIPLDRFIAVIDDIHRHTRGLTDGLWPMKHHLPDIRATLIAQNQLQPISPSSE